MEIMYRIQSTFFRDRIEMNRRHTAICGLVKLELILCSTAFDVFIYSTMRRRHCVQNIISIKVERGNASMLAAMQLFKSINFIFNSLFICAFNKVDFLLIWYVHLPSKNRFQFAAMWLNVFICEYGNVIQSLPEFDDEKRMNEHHERHDLDMWAAWTHKSTLAWMEVNRECSWVLTDFAKTGPKTQVLIYFDDLVVLFLSPFASSGLHVVLSNNANDHWVPQIISMFSKQLSIISIHSNRLLPAKCSKFV